MPENKELNKRDLIRQLNGYHQALQALAEASHKIIGMRDPDDICQSVCHAVRDIFDLRLSWLGLIDEDCFDIIPGCICGPAGEYAAGITVRWDDSPEGKGPSGMAVKTRQPQVKNDIANDPAFHPWHESAARHGLGSSMAVPLVCVRDKTIGVLNLYSSEVGFFSEDRLRMIQTFANQAATAIENARLVTDLEKEVEKRTRKISRINDRLKREISVQKKTEKALRNSEERISSILRIAHDAIISVDTDMRIEVFNEGAEEQFGYAATEVLGRPLDILIPEEFHLAHREHVKKFIGGEDAVRPMHGYREVQARKKNGGTFFAEASISKIHIAGEVILTVMLRDVSARKDAEKAMRLASSVIDNTPEGVMITDTQLKIISVNQAFIKTSGYSMEEAIGQTPRLLHSGRHDKVFYQKMWEDIGEKGQWQGEIWNRRKDGDIYPEWLNISVIKGDDGIVLHYAGIFSDLSSQEQFRTDLHNLAYYDALTGLPNRELFMDRLENALVKARRDDTAIALMFIDLDRFKNINDTLGHSVGDELLKAVSRKLTGCVRKVDTVARLGGDEFTITLASIAHPEDAAKVAETILHSFKEPLDIGGRELFISPSIGISTYPADGKDSEALIKNADTAMYRVKEEGRNSFQFYRSEMSKKFFERLALENELRKALESNQLKLAYQPQVSMATGSIVGMEALARWKHVELGWVSPDVFIPIAEETGLIGALGEWALRAACIQAKAWVDAGHTGLRMAVNLSTIQIQQADIPDIVAKCLQETGLEPRNLELELTESEIMEHAEATVETLIALKKMGVHLAIDDFGTGYSSLSYLKRFAIDKLKIDKSFIDDISTDPNDAEIVAAVIVMAHNLKLEVVAEGVETEDQLSFLRWQECDEIQGYLFSKPVPAAEMQAMLEEGRVLELPQLRLD